MFIDRRHFLSSLAGILAAGPVSATTTPEASTSDVDRRSYHQRAKSLTSFQLRQVRPPITNGDETAFSSYFACYSKGLPHLANGEVDTQAYEEFLDAMQRQDFAALENIQTGGTTKLVNPLGCAISQNESADPQDYFLSPPPTFSSLDQAAELIELYWAALCRDVPFLAYDADPLCNSAMAELSQFETFQDIKSFALFRGPSTGDLIGPYVSQFLLRDVPYGHGVIKQQYAAPAAGQDYMTSYDAWLAIQSGWSSQISTSYSDDPRYISNGRRLAEFVRKDFSYQAFLNAALILLGFGPVALSQNNPYRRSTTQQGFVTYGGPDILCAVAKAATYALNATWYQKWAIHRRLRPEEFAGRVESNLKRGATYPIHDRLRSSEALERVHAAYGSYLLPQAYPEGCPLHPAYPSGHAMIAGACVSVLKAFFDESFVIPNPKVTSDDGRALLAYPGDLTVGDELNKLASNIALGRNIAGIHWRSDALAGLLLGEEVAIELLREGRRNTREHGGAASFTRFNGQRAAI
jgi:membrane-associated phospholipid phosphatase